ncbi:hypothetical protein Bbelb_415470 [Branchiostoma belcheri]|nr:hypothetical protein Bbelb_415470 [Branchiostoma belcheri]
MPPACDTTDTREGVRARGVTAGKEDQCGREKKLISSFWSRSKSRVTVRFPDVVPDTRKRFQSGVSSYSLPTQKLVTPGLTTTTIPFDVPPRCMTGCEGITGNTASLTNPDPFFSRLLLFLGCCETCVTCVLRSL